MTTSLTKLLFILVLFFALTARADDAPTPAAPAANTSAGNRQDKKWGWFGGAGNFTFGNVYMFGISGGANLFLTPNDLLVVEIGEGTNYDFLSSIGGDTVNGWTAWQGVYFKHFVANSFYLKGGIETTQIHYNVTHYPTFGGSSFSQTAYINLYSLKFGLGNQWQRHRLTFGCDWASLVVPVFNNAFGETDSGPSLDPWNLKSQLTKVGGEFGHFYIGMNF